MASCPRVQHHHDAADGHEGQGELDRPAVQGVVDAQGHGDDREHPGQHQDPMQQVVGVEAVGVHRVAGPCPPDGDEQAGRAQEVTQGAVLLQRVDDLGDRDDEHQVEEQLEPGGAPLALVGLQRAQLWRPEPPLPLRRRHPRLRLHDYARLPQRT
jgi:hypothetical protein